MDGMLDFARGEANQGKPQMVFDWNYTRALFKIRKIQLRHFFDES